MKHNHTNPKRLKSREAGPWQYIYITFQIKSHFDLHSPHLRNYILIGNYCIFSPSFEIENYYFNY